MATLSPTPTKPLVNAQGLTPAQMSALASSMSKTSAASVLPPQPTISNTSKTSTTPIVTLPKPSTPAPTPTASVAVPSPAPSASAPGVTTLPKISTPAPKPAPAPTAAQASATQQAQINSAANPSYVAPDKLAAQIAAMQQQVLQNATPAARLAEEARLSGGASAAEAEAYKTAQNPFTATMTTPGMGDFAPSAPASTAAPADTAGLGGLTTAGSPTPDQYQALLDQYQKSLTALSAPSEAETAAQTALDKLVQEQANLDQAKRLGLETISEQPIELGFITGQQAATERRATNLETGLEAQELPLKDKLARIQAQRQAALDIQSKMFDAQSKQALQQEAEQAAYNKAELTADQLKTLAPGAAAIDPSTGEIIYTNPNRPIAAEQPKFIPASKYNVAGYFDPSTGTFTPISDAQKTVASGTGGSTGSTSSYTANLAKLNASKGPDGYVNTGTYAALRSALKSTDRTAFDDNFSYLLNPSDPSAKGFLPKGSATTGPLF